MGAGFIEAYKASTDATESGVGAPYYQTTFSDTAADPSDALITWNGPSFFSSNPLYILVKDGAQTPAWYLFQITVGGAGNWDGQENLDLQDFWKDNSGEIGYVAIYGKPNGPATNLLTTAVPDGGSMSMLLGMGLMGLAAARRMFGRH